MVPSISASFPLTQAAYKLRSMVRKHLLQVTWPNQHPLRPSPQATLGNSQGVHDGKQKVLGVNWSVLSDQFIFSFAELAKQAQGVEPTKRSIISLIGRIYDPLGFLAQTVVSLKVFMQSLCETRIGLDETIPESMSTRWYKLVAALARSGG